MNNFENPGRVHGKKEQKTILVGRCIYRSFGNALTPPVLFIGNSSLDPNGPGGEGYNCNCTTDVWTYIGEDAVPQTLYHVNKCA
jgi:hypothetical protein